MTALQLASIVVPPAPSGANPAPAEYAVPVTPMSPSGSLGVWNDKMDESAPAFPTPMYVDMSLSDTPNGKEPASADKPSRLSVSGP